MVDLPNNIVDLHIAMFDLPNTMVDLPNGGVKNKHVFLSTFCG